MQTSYVDIGKFEGDDMVLLARCVWRGSGPVEITGDPDIVAGLASVGDMKGNEKTPADGMEFLRAVSESFRTPYLMASSVQEGEPPAATTA